MTLILNGTDNSATTPAVTGTDTDTGVYYPAANQVAIATSGTQAMLANASQGVQFANAIGVGATTPTTSGAGITFPATANLSSNANTLDDYEEGTFAPNLTGTSSAPTITYTVQSGTYIKVGRMVTVFIRLSWSSFTGGGGNLRITNLPFTGATDSDECGGSVGIATSFSTAPVQNQVDSSSTVLFFFTNTANTSSTVAQVGASGSLHTTTSYTTDS
jgi:hypothetical protein